MIKSVTIINHLGKSTPLVLARPEESGFAITNISGISPGDATINVLEGAVVDGGKFTSGRRGIRNIVFNMAAFELGGFPVETIRHNLYTIFRLKNKARIIFCTDERQVYTDGWVESIEADIFSQQETFQVSLICPDPDFYLYNEFDGYIYREFISVEPTFEFPFSNESLTDRLLVISEVSGETVIDIDYEGDSLVGCVIALNLQYAVADITITSRTGIMTVSLSALKQKLNVTDLTGYKIELSSIEGEKGVYVITPAGVRINALDTLVRTNEEIAWVELEPGTNRIGYDFGPDSYLANAELFYPVKYVGV